METKWKIVIGIVVTVFILTGAGIYYQMKQQEAKQTLTNGIKTEVAQKKDKTIVKENTKDKEIILAKEFAKTYIERELDSKYIDEQKESLSKMMTDSAQVESGIMNQLDEYKEQAIEWNDKHSLNTMTSVERLNRDVDKTEIKKDGNKFYITVTYHTTNPISKQLYNDDMKKSDLKKGLVITIDNGLVSSVVEQG